MNLEKPNNERFCTFEQFNWRHPPTFDVRDNSNMAGTLNILGYKNQQKIRFTAFKLTRKAKRWKISERAIKEANGIGGASWPHFKQILIDHFFPRFVRDTRAQEFMDLVQWTMTVYKYAKKFVEISHFASYLILDEENKTTMFERCLNHIIHERAYFSKLEFLRSSALGGTN